MNPFSRLLPALLAALALSLDVSAGEPTDDELIRRWRSWCDTIANDFSVKGEITFAPKFGIAKQRNVYRRKGEMSSFNIEYSLPGNKMQRLAHITNRSYIANLSANEGGKWAVSEIALDSSPEYSTLQREIEPLEIYLNPARICHYLSNFKYAVEELKRDSESCVLKIKIDTSSVEDSFKIKMRNLLVSVATITFVKSSDWLPTQVDLEFDVPSKERDNQTAMRMVYSEWEICPKGKKLPTRISVYGFKQPVSADVPSNELRIIEYNRFGDSDKSFCSLVGYGLPEIGNPQGSSWSSWIIFGVVGMVLIASGFFLKKRFAT